VLRALIIGLTVVAIAPSHAKNNSGGCLSLSQARDAWPSTWLRYRVVDGDHCWFAPGKRMIDRPKRTSARSRIIEMPRDDLSRVGDALCGAPCPRFDLDAPVYRALCGGPCPDFRFIDPIGTVGRTSSC